MVFENANDVAEARSVVRALLHAQSCVMPRQSHSWLQEESSPTPVIGAFFSVHNTLGFRFLERVYSHALQVELELRAHRVVREHPVTLSKRRLLSHHLQER